MLEKIFGDYVELGVSLISAALILSSISICMGLSDKYQEKQLESQIAATEIREQRNNLFYNNTNVFQQDIVSLIIKYKGDKQVHVRLKNGTTYQWTNLSKSSDYKVSDVSLLLPKDVAYNAGLMYGPNMSSVIGYQFVER